MGQEESSPRGRPSTSRSRADILIVFASETIRVQVSDRRGNVFYEAYADFGGDSPQYFGLMNPSINGDVYQ
jgi:hypothetical protein